MTTTTALTAWITTATSMPEADPGLTVAHNPDAGQVGWVDSTDVDLADGDGIDADHADRLLAELGYRRTGDWTLSGGQWAAGVELGLTLPGPHPAVAGAGAE